MRDTPIGVSPLPGPEPGTLQGPSVIFKTLQRKPLMSIAHTQRNPTLSPASCLPPHSLGLLAHCLQPQTCLSVLQTCAQGPASRPGTGCSPARAPAACMTASCSSFRSHSGATSHSVVPVHPLSLCPLLNPLEPRGPAASGLAGPGGQALCCAGCCASTLRTMPGTEQVLGSSTQSTLLVAEAVGGGWGSGGRGQRYTFQFKINT